ncbi:MAG: TolC family protein [Thermotogota bacterium]|nr:TolC family protein [Thermotogota bacterium]
MKRLIFLVITLLVGILSIFGMTFEELYEQNLEKNSAYTQAELNLRSAEIEMNKMDNFFVPYLGISVDTMKTTIGLTSEGLPTDRETIVSGLVFGGEGELEGYNISLNVNFLEVWGAQVGVSFPFTLNTDEWTIDTPEASDIAISLSRDLTIIDRAERLKTESSYYDALSKYYMAQTNELITTIEDIFTRYYNEEMIQTYQDEIEILNQQYNLSTDEDEKENLEKQILAAQKNLETLRASNAPLEYFEYTDELYSQAKDMVKGIINDKQKYPTNIEERLDLKSLQLQEEASQIESNFWFIPYLPFNEISVSLNPFFEEGENLIDNLSISVGFQLAILDKGERKLAADTMKTDVAALTYDESMLEVGNAIRNLETTRRTLNYDVKINQIDLENAMEDYNRNKELNSQGYITKEELKLSEIALERAQLASEKTENDILTNELKIMQQYYVDIWGDIN